MKKFKRGYRETFKVEDEVRVAKNENLVGKQKEWKRRFVELGVVKVQMPRDSYLVKWLVVSWSNKDIMI